MQQTPPDEERREVRDLIEPKHGCVICRRPSDHLLRINVMNQQPPASYYACMCLKCKKRVVSRTEDRMTSAAIAWVTAYYNLVCRATRGALVPDGVVVWNIVERRPALIVEAGH